MPDLLQIVAGMCFEMEKSTSWAQVRDCLHSAAARFGAEFFLFGVRTGKSILPSEQIIVSNYPKPWQRFYDEAGAFAFDPVFKRALEFKGTFRWDGLHKDEQQMSLRRESIRNGMEFGITFSEFGPDASLALMSFCGGKPIATGPSEWEPFAASVALYAATTHKAVVRIVLARRAQQQHRSEPLTESECRALELMAEAMTAVEAAGVMNVSTRTVRYYLDRAAEKLGVDTRREAVMKALAEGIIDKRRFPTIAFGGGTEFHN